MKKWKIEVAGPAGYERPELFWGHDLDEALEVVRQNGVAWVSDEDGNPIAQEVKE